MSIFSVKRSLEKLAFAADCPPITPVEVFSPQIRSCTNLSAQQLIVIDDKNAALAVDTLKKYQGVLGCDIETTPLDQWKQHSQAGLDPHLSKIRTVQFATDDSIFVFDLMHVDIHILHELWQKPLVFHNAKFDVKFLLHAGIKPTKVGCTLLMDLILNGGGSGKKLSDLSKELLKIEISKGEQTSDWSGELTQSQISYAALDAIIVKRICDKLLHELKKRNMSSIASIFNRAILATASMELTGIPFDWGEHHQVVEEWQQEFKDLESSIQRDLSMENMNSSKELQQKFHEHFIKNNYAIVNGKNGLPKLGKKELAKYKSDPLIARYLQYACLKTRLSTFGESLATLANPVTKRIHPNFMHGRARTGRFATSKPNTQNFPNGTFKTIVRPIADRVFVVADYSQIELRLIAIVADEDNMLSAYRNGEDLHRLTASRILNISPDEVTKIQRTCAKAVNFGFIYGQKEAGFITVAKNDYGLEISYNEAQAYRNAFFASYPKIASWHQEVANSIRKTGAIRTLNGWERRFTSETDKMVCEKEKTLERKHNQIASLDARLSKEEQLQRGYQKRLQEQPTHSRTQDLLEKKNALVDELRPRLEKLRQESRQLERKIKLAKSEQNVVHIPKMLDEYRNILFSAYNLPIQGLGCELMAVALTKTYDCLQGTSAQIINCVHDEIIVECAQEEAENISQKLKTSMFDAFVDMFPSHEDTTKGLIDIKIAQNWGEAK